MDETENEREQLRGAKARAAGKSALDNPWLKSENMPAATGKSLEEWHKLHDLWHFGWTLENALRS